MYFGKIVTVEIIIAEIFYKLFFIDFLCIPNEIFYVADYVFFLFDVNCLY